MGTLFGSHSGMPLRSSFKKENSCSATNSRLSGQPPAISPSGCASTSEVGAEAMHAWWAIPTMWMSMVGHWYLALPAQCGTPLRSNLWSGAPSRVGWNLITSAFWSEAPRFPFRSVKSASQDQGFLCPSLPRPFTFQRCYFSILPPNLFLSWLSQSWLPGGPKQALF